MCIYHIFNYDYYDHCFSKSYKRKSSKRVKKYRDMSKIIFHADYKAIPFSNL